MKNIEIKNARFHNLKGIDISIPKNKLVIATGVSGSGKSSLVFDIIFEEGRKQYLQSLGILTGLDDEEKFDSISGIGPTIAIQQNIIRQSNPRSTIGSKTGILNMLAVLYACEGQILCPNCDILVNEKLVCNNCGNIAERLEPNCFSYNNPNGMCIKCSGRGTYFQINFDKLIPNEKTTLQDVFDLVAPTPGYLRLLSNKFKEFLHKPFNQIPDETKEEIIYGHHVNSNFQQRSYSLTSILHGRLYLKGDNTNEIYTNTVCSDCKGFRIGEEALRVQLNGKHIGHLGKMTISELDSFLGRLLEQNELSIRGKNIIKDILRKTQSLIKSHLDYLSLYREMPSLSGGEIQRLFLHSHLDSKMDSLIYILDEPTKGLHESEKEVILAAIKKLKELGNSVIVVEHDLNTIKMAEEVIDIGPKAGIEGGQVVYQGDYQGLLQCNDSITGQYLSGKLKMPFRELKQNIKTLFLTIKHAKTNNLKDITVSIPLGALIGIAGVSGSGKSSLISDTLIPLLKSYFREPPDFIENEPVENGTNEEMESEVIETIADQIEGIENIAGFVEVSQAPIGRHMNSNPASYIGIWDKIRKLYSQQPESIQKNLSAGHFSFNSKGACSVCGGSGREKIWLGGNLNIYNTCKTCFGKRFNQDALAVKYNGKNIFEILEMTVSDAVNFFKEYSGIISTLKVLDRIGMGYITLGQPTPTLSGGESQRIKLAKEIGRKRKGNILYVLDEPTTGLSLYDTAKLIALIDELVKKGNSVVVIEHDPVVLSCCDWIIELGPKAGLDGGRIIAEGTPQMLKNNPTSTTGPYLKIL
jgi:excinuclease ABC A subunit